MDLAARQMLLCACQCLLFDVYRRMGHISSLHHWPFLTLCCWRCRHDKQGGMDSFYVDHESWAFAIRKWLGGAKFYLIRSLMNALGYTSLAKKVWAGWQVRNISTPLPFLLTQLFQQTEI